MQSQCAIKPNRNTLLTNYLQLLFPMSDQTVLATLSMVAFSVVVIHGRDCNHAQQIQGKVETGPTAPYRILGSQYPPRRSDSVYQLPPSWSGQVCSNQSAPMDHAMLMVKDSDLGPAVLLPSLRSITTHSSKHFL